MNLINPARLLIVAAVLLCPVYAQAAVNLSLNFAGEVSPGSSGDVLIYSTDEVDTTSYDGQPVSIDLTIRGNPGSLYVSDFSMTWSNQVLALPFATGASGTGYAPEPFNDTQLGFLSIVNLGSTGGSIRIYPTFEFGAFTDGNFILDFNFSFSQPHNPYSAFTDNGLTGGGSMNLYLNRAQDPNIGTYDAFADANFTLSTLSQAGSAPEPSAWAMLLLGFASLGFAARMRRSRGVGEIA